MMQVLFNELAANGPLGNTALVSVIIVLIYALLRICTTLALIIRLCFWQLYFKLAGVKPKVHRAMVEEASKRDLRRRKFWSRKKKTLD